MNAFHTAPRAGLALGMTLFLLCIVVPVVQLTMPAVPSLAAGGSGIDARPQVAGPSPTLTPTPLEVRIRIEGTAGVVTLTVTPIAGPAGTVTPTVPVTPTGPALTITPTLPATLTGTTLVRPAAPSPTPPATLTPAPSATPTATLAPTAAPVIVPTATVQPPVLKRVPTPRTFTVPDLGTEPPVAPPAPAVPVARIVDPPNGAAVPRVVVVSGVLSRLQPGQRAFLCVQSTAFGRLIWPQGEIVPGAGGWAVRSIYASAGYAYLTFVVVTADPLALAVLTSDNAGRNGIAQLPPGAFVVSDVFRYQRR